MQWPQFLISTSIAAALLAWVLGTKRAALIVAGGLVLTGLLLLAILRENLLLMAGLVGFIVVPLTIGAAVLGLGAGACFRRKKYFLGSTFLILPLSFVIFTFARESKQDAILRQGMEFITHEEHVVNRFGQPVDARLLSWTVNRENKITQILYAIEDGEVSFRATVDVSEDKSAYSFELVCLTQVPRTKRERDENPCTEYPGELPDVK